VLCHKLWQKYVAVWVVKGLFQDHGYGGHFYGRANCMTLKGSQGSILYYPMAIMNVEYFSFVSSDGFTWEFVISTNGLCLGWQIDKLSFIKPTQWVEIWPHNSQTSMVRTHCSLLLCVVWSAANFLKNIVCQRIVPIFQGWGLPIEMPTRPSTRLVEYLS
jgi:hypothetical protein